MNSPRVELIMKLLTVNKNKEQWLKSKTLVDGRYYIDGYRATDGSELVCFSKLDPGKSYAQITAKGTIHYYVINGTMSVGDQAFDSGSYVRVEAGHQFTPRSDVGCEVFCVYTIGYDRKEAAPTAADTRREKLLSMNKDHGQWVPSTTGLPGRLALRCWYDKNSGEVVAFYRLAARTTYELITALGTVHYYVIDGALLVGDQSFDTGSYVRVEAGYRFTPRSDSGCEVLCIYTKGFNKEGQVKS